MPEYEDSALRAITPKLLSKRIPAAPLRGRLFSYIPAAAPLIRWVMRLVGKGCFHAFDGSLKYRYVMGSNLVIHREAVYNGRRRLSQTLPKRMIKGAPQDLQANFDGTVFYLATKNGTAHYIYVIDIKRKGITEHRLKNLGSGITRMDSDPGWRDTNRRLKRQRLVFACNNRRHLRLPNALPKQEVISVGRSVALLKELENGRLKFGYFSLARAHAPLRYFPDQTAGFIAVNGNDAYLAAASHVSIVRFNIKTKTTFIKEYNHLPTVIEKWSRVPTFMKKCSLYGGALYSRVCTADTIHTVDSNLHYQVIGATAWNELYAMRLPISAPFGEEVRMARVSPVDTRRWPAQPAKTHLRNDGPAISPEVAARRDCRRKATAGF